MARLYDEKALGTESVIPGTKGGYFCQGCGQECMLAPSRQKIMESGKNPLYCIECIVKMSDEEKFN